MTYRDRLLSGAALLAAASLTALPAQAQDAPAPAATTQQDDAGQGLGEIVVTANKRAENVQRVPAAITAIAPDTALSGSGGNLQAVQGLVPNVEINASNAATGVSIRGIFSTNDSGQGDPAAAFHVDGVYLGRPQSTGGLLYDIDRIEVLRGPQGTLYGRNATAGAVNVITSKPVYQLEGEVGAEYGNYDQYGFNGMLNLPLVDDKLAVRAAFRTLKHDGYAADGFTDDYDGKAGRLHVLYEPSDAFSLLVSGDYDLREGVGNAAYKLGVPNVDPRSTNLANPGAHIRNENWGVRSEANIHLGDVTVTLLPAYHHYSLDNLYASDRRIQWNQTAKQTSFEARVASSSDKPLTWIVGAFYWEERQNYVQKLLAPPTSVQFAYPLLDSFSAAVFGQATWSVNDQLRLTGGLRYTSDRKKQMGTTEIRNPAGVLLRSFANVADTSWDALNWKATVEYDVAERSMLYFTAATGYKAGGNYDGLPPNSYDPENILSFEIGSKNRFLDNALQLNLDAFYYRYDDYQASQLGCLNLPAGIPPCSASGRITYNADKATVYGVELEAQWAITRLDRLSLVSAYTYSKFDDFVLPVTPYSSGGDFSGNPLPKSPRFQVTLDYSHRFELGGAGSIEIAGRFRHVSEQYLLFDISNPIVHQPGYETGDATITYASPGGNWELAGYVNNIGDALVKSYAFGTSTPGVFYGTYLPPRTYGARVTFKF